MTCITVFWQDEKGSNLEEFLDPGLDPALLSAPGVSDTTCLRFVDPYGNTVFNQLQIPILASEIEALASELPPVSAANANALARFLREKQDKMHTYIKVVGD